jgi:hypothetical protein
MIVLNRWTPARILLVGRLGRNSFWTHKTGAGGAGRLIALRDVQMGRFWADRD